MRLDRKPAARPIAGAGPGAERRRRVHGRSNTGRRGRRRAPGRPGLIFALGCAAGAVGRRRPEPPAGRGERRPTGYLAGRRPTVQRWGIPLGGFIPAHPELREGMTGEAVRELQEKLSLATAAGGALYDRRRLRAGDSPSPACVPYLEGLGKTGRRCGPMDGARRRGRGVAGAGPAGPERRLQPTSPSRSRSHCFAGAAAPLQIDGVFTIVMTAFVSAFQAGQHITVNGHGRRKNRLGGGAGMEGGAPVEQHVANRAGASPSRGAADGHDPALGRSAPVGFLRGAGGAGVPAQAQRLAQTPTAGAEITDDGKRGNDTRTATVAFQVATPGLSPGSGIGDQST